MSNHDWVNPIVGDFLARWRDLKGDYSADQADLVREWVRSRLLGGSESFSGEDSFYFVGEWAGDPVLALIADDRVVLMSLDDMAIETRYLGALYGGSYREHWCYLPAENRFELELVFEHDALPGTISLTLETLKQIDQAGVEPTRERFRRWAEDRRS